jgi:hypothetical protein
MTYTSEPPTEPGWYYVETTGTTWDRDGQWTRRILKLDHAHWTGEEVGSIYLDPRKENRFGPRIPSPEEIEAMEECVKIMRDPEAPRCHSEAYSTECEGNYQIGDQPRDCDCGATLWNDQLTAALARLDAIRGESQ